MRTRKKTSMYGISRIDDGVHRTHAWRVSLRRRGELFVKNFPDKKWGGKGKALRYAKQYRDELVTRHTPITRQEFASILRANNRTGITGVYRYAKRYQLKDGTLKEIWYWEANWPLKEGGSAKVSYSVKKYGEKVAKHMAIQAREEGMKKLEGFFWPSLPGVTPDMLDRMQANSKTSGRSKRSRKAASKAA